MWIILTIFIFALSIYLSFKFKFNNYKLDIRKLMKKDKTSFFLTLGTKVGVGSIIGTTSSILIGGFSSVIWIIVFGVITSSIIYYESYLGRKYRTVSNGEYIGGPFFILRDGVKSKILHYIALLLLVIVYCFFFQMIQMNTISNIIVLNTGINKSVIFVCSLILLVIVTSFSIKDTLSAMNKLVPLMCLIFILFTIKSIIVNLNDLIMSFKYQFNNIFNIKSIFCGMVIGIKRSIFMNEVLIGTTAVASASDNNEESIGVKYQVLSSLFISIVVTSLITCLLLIYLNNNNISGDYINVLNNVFYYNGGREGIIILMITFILFGFTTILSGYYIGKNYISYLFSDKVLIIFKLIFITMSVLGTVISNSFIWNFIDNLIFVMIIINSYSIIKLLGSGKCDR